ncbi:MAG: putative signal transduction response regulator, receiver domain protein [Nitrososphaeraceae archaeon]|nr:putative signal transduction response regulator, receiver domain protein [Nitrososphaeraceae archaeon]
MALNKESIMGFNVDSFTDPFLALEHFHLNSKDYTIVISDIRMPGINGFEFVRKIREVKPKIKVLLMTAFDINATVFSEELLATKVNGFIQKPISLKILNSEIKKHTNGIKPIARLTKN